MFMRSIIGWCDKKEKEAYDDPSTSKGCMKICASGLVESICDTALILAPVLLISCFMYDKELNKK